ncbi:MAG: hypothetical protein ACLTG8_08610 [Alistipes finegoldii]|uniref:hypothetical protein n=1 Tax=Alistipes finegoldii TaxID=214856 RepID=UPI0039949C4F
MVSIGKALLKKERKVIAVDDMQRLHDWLQENNRYFLLVCYFLHYMLIRPKEIAKLRLCDISVSKQTVYIDDTISKNKRSACVTIPQKIIELMAELGYFDAPSTYYIFFQGFQTGAGMGKRKDLPRLLEQENPPCSPLSQRVQIL